MNKYFMAAFAASLFSVGAAVAEDIKFTNPLVVDPMTSNNINTNTNIPAPGNLKALNTNPSNAYDPSRVETKLNVDIKESTKAVHFIRDNNDPRVVTKAYLVKNADPFILRGVLKKTLSTTIDNNPVSIESVQYVDGSAVLLISAEEYRFKNALNGMTMDQLVETFDKKDLPNSSGTVDMAYFPRYNKASTLLHMLHKSGMGIFAGGINPDDPEIADEFADTQNSAYTFDENGLHVNPGLLAGGVADAGMNAIIMTGPGYEVKETLRFLKDIDHPTEEVYLKYKLVEVYAENDQKLGLDFQAWKNNDGVDFFSVGGKYGRNNWGGALIPDNGYRYSEYYNFNPKWNTKYLDFLTTCGKAKIVSSGSISVANGHIATMTQTDGFFSITGEYLDGKNFDLTMPDPATENGDVVGAYGRRLVEVLTGTAEAAYKHEVATGRTQEIAAQSGNCFSLAVTGDVHSSACNLQIGLNSVSLIGWDGSGTPRLSTSVYNTKIMIGSEAKDFVVGGITKTTVVRSVSGIPFLKDLPIIGYLFSTEADTVKKSQFVLIASAEVLHADSTLKADTKAELEDLTAKITKAEQNPKSTTGFQQLGLDK